MGRRTNSPLAAHRQRYFSWPCLVLRPAPSTPYSLVLALPRETRSHPDSYGDSHFPKRAPLAFCRSHCLLELSEGASQALETLFGTIDSVVTGGRRRTIRRARDPEHSLSSAACLLCPLYLLGSCQRRSVYEKPLARLMVCPEAQKRMRRGWRCRPAYSRACPRTERRGRAYRVWPRG